MKLIVHTDGGGSATKGPASAAFVAYTEDGTCIASQSRKFESTSNVAEYTGVALAGLALPAILKRYPADEIEFRCDSQLIARQMSGEYKAKNKYMAECRRRAWQILNTLGVKVLRFTWIRREENDAADLLCDEALEGRVKDDIWAPMPAERTKKPKASDRPSLGQLWKAGKLGTTTFTCRLEVTEDGKCYPHCNRCRKRCEDCTCPPLEETDGMVSGMGLPQGIDRALDDGSGATLPA